MLNIGEFFKKIKNKHSQELFIRSTIKDVIKKHTKIELAIESISLKSSTVSLKGVSQTARSQMFIKKQIIIDEINAVQTIRKITDVR